MTSPTTKRRALRGFSLIEATIAGGVLILGMTGITIMLIRGSVNSRNGHQLMTAANHSNRVLAELAAKKFEGLGPTQREMDAGYYKDNSGRSYPTTYTIQDLSDGGWGTYLLSVTTTFRDGDVTQHAPRHHAGHVGRDAVEPELREHVVAWLVEAHRRGAVALHEHRHLTRHARGPRGEGGGGVVRAVDLYAGAAGHRLGTESGVVDGAVERLRGPIHLAHRHHRLQRRTGHARHDADDGDDGHDLEQRHASPPTAHRPLHRILLNERMSPLFLRGLTGVLVRPPALVLKYSLSLMTNRSLAMPMLLSFMTEFVWPA
jgi:hypothetical protein